MIDVTLRVFDTGFLLRCMAPRTTIHGLGQKKCFFDTGLFVTRFCILLPTDFTVLIDRRLYNVALSTSFRTIQHFRTVYDVTSKRRTTSTRKKTGHDRGPLRNKSFVTTVVFSSCHRRSQLISIHPTAKVSGLAMRRWCTPIRYHLH